MRCAQRDADIANRQRRQADYVDIPTASVKPVMLLVDSRIPRVRKTAMAEKLKGIHFGCCSLTLTNPHLISEMQELLDAGKHILFFADRGEHYRARSFFVANFKTLLSCLSPCPKVICVDGADAIRFENWNGYFAAEQVLRCVDVFFSVLFSVSE